MSSENPHVPRLRNWAFPLTVIYVLLVAHVDVLDRAFRYALRENAVEYFTAFVVLAVSSIIAKYWQRHARTAWNWWLKTAILFAAMVIAFATFNHSFRGLLQRNWPLFLAAFGVLLAFAGIERLRKKPLPLVRNWGFQWALLTLLAVWAIALNSPTFRDFSTRNWRTLLVALALLPVASALIRERGLETPGRLRGWAFQSAAAYGVVLCTLYLANAGIRETVQVHWLWYADIFLAFVLVGILAKPRGLELYTEYPAGNEQATIDTLIDLFIKRLKEEYRGGELTLRDTHPKSNGLIFCEFEVLPDLPPGLNVGLFSRPKNYKCWARFSNSEPDVTSDRRPDFRGFALKLFEVPGDKLQDDEQGTFDFLLIAHDAFFAANPKDFLSFFSNLFAHGAAMGQFFYFFPQRIRLLINALVGRRVYGHPFEISWFSCAPYRLGDKVVKYKLQSVWPQSEPDRGNPDYLRERLTQTLSERGHTMELMVQFQEDPNRDLIETTAIPWRIPEFHTVARLHIPQQDFNSLDHHQFDESLTFNPWHCLPEHRPVGGINRARRDVMRAIQEFRLAANRENRTNVNEETPDDAPAAAQT